MDYIKAFALIFAGAFFFKLAIEVLLTPADVYSRNYRLTESMNTGYVDSEHVETLLSVDSRSGSLVLTQQIKKESLLS